MRQVQRVLANYSADLFGVCSALYELGGLIVMHDASGCNSTYNTHDEPRWYDTDSMIYVSGLTERDAVLGNDNRLIADVLEAAEETKPKFIVVCGSPMPYLIGTDFPGIARIIEKKCGIPTFGFHTNGMHTYVRGAGEAFSGIAERFCLEKHKIKRDGISVNLLGVTPLDFSINGNVQALKSFITGHGFILNSTWAMEDSLENLSKAGDADVNVVVSSVGLPAAEVLKHKFGTPYVVGLPVGTAASKKLVMNITEAAPSDLRVRKEAFPDFPEEKSNLSDSSIKSARFTIIGEAVFISSLRTCLKADLGIENVKVICPTEESAGVLESEDILTDEEDAITKICGSESDFVIADPIYRRIFEPESPVSFVDLPHEAYSGRLYHDIMPVFIGKNMEKWMIKKLTDGFCK